MGDVAAVPLPPPALSPSTPCYVTGEEALRLTVFNAAVGVTVSLRGRFLPAVQSADDPPARVGPFQFDLVPTTDRVATVRTQTLGEGWILDWSVIVTGGSPPIGQCYAIVGLVRGTSGNVQELSTLGFGPVTAKQRLSWPTGVNQGFVDGAGALRSITGTLPGAGAEISEVVPTGARWTLIAFEADLATAVAVANRVPQLTIDDGANVYSRVSVNQSETASQTWRNSFQLGVPQLADLTRFVIATPLPPGLTLGPGHRIRTVTAGIQAADQWAAPQYLVIEKIEAT